MSQAEASSAEFTWPTYNKDERYKIDREFKKVKNNAQRTKKYDELMKPMLGDKKIGQRLRGMIGRQSDLRDEAWKAYFVAIISIILAISPQLYETYLSFTEKVEYQYKTCHTFDDSGSPITKGFDGFLPQCELEIQFTKAVDEKVGVYVKKDEEGRCVEFYSTIYEKYGSTSDSIVSNIFFFLCIVISLYFCYQRYYELENICITFYYKATIVKDLSLKSKFKEFAILWLSIALFFCFKFFYNPKSYETVALIVTSPEDPFCESLKTSTFQDDETLDVRCESCVDWPDQNLLEFRTEKRDTPGEVFSTLLLCYVWYQVATTSKGYYGFIDGDTYMMSKEDDLPIYFNIHEMRKRQMTLERAEDHKYWFKQQALAEFSPDEEKTAMMMKAV